MTITEQGRRWEVKEAMRVTMREWRRQRDELWRLENNNRNWTVLPAHTRGDRSLPSQFKEVHQSGSTTGVWNLVLIVKVLRGRRRRKKWKKNHHESEEPIPLWLALGLIFPTHFKNVANTVLKKKTETRVTQEHQHTLSHDEKTNRAALGRGKKGERGGEKWGRGSILKFSSWQALIFRHSN